MIMRPGEKQSLNEIKQDKNSLAFWKNKYLMNMKDKKIDFYKNNNTFEDIQNDFVSYQKKIFEKNSKTLIYFLHKLNFLGAFQRLNIFVLDNEQNYEYSIFSGLKKTNNNQYDIGHIILI